MLSFFPRVWDFIRHPTQSRTMGIAIMLVLVSAVSLTVIVSQQQQSTKQRASGEECQLDATSCETEFNQCLSQCDISKSNTAKFYTCTIYSYNDQNCQEQVNAIGGGMCGEQDVPTDCNDLGEENGSSKTVCFEDSSCASSNNENCVTSCGQQKSICDNNIAVQYSNCLTNQTFSVAIPTEASETPALTARPAGDTEVSTPAPVCQFDSQCPSDNNPCTTEYCNVGKCISLDNSTCAANPISPTNTPVPATPTVAPADQSSIPTPTASNSTAGLCPLKSKGDANCDEKIDNSDYEIWLGEFTKILTTALSDFNNDGTITTLDFNIWRDNSLYQQ